MTFENIVSALRLIVGTVAGYLLTALLITLVQEVIFGGVGYYESGLLELSVAGFLTVGCAVAGGFAAAWMAGRWWLASAFLMSGLVTAETTYLTQSGKLDGPLWFDVIAASSLMAGFFIGAFLYRKSRKGKAVTSPISTVHTTQ